MTDANDTEQAPRGTKRRGSTELQAPVDGLQALQQNVSTTDEEEPQPTAATTDNNDDDKAPDISPYDNNNNNNNDDDNKAPDIAPTTYTLLQQPTPKAAGHRRRNTDGAVKYNASGTTMFKSASSNAAVIQLMQSELPPSERRNMQNQATNLRLERDLKHTQMKLHEFQDQCKTAVEIIGKLEEEKEDLLSVDDTLRTQLGSASTEIKILDQKVKSLEEAFRSERNKYEEELRSTKKQLSEMEEDMTQKNLALNEAKQYQKSMQHRLDDGDGLELGNNKKLSSKKQKQLLKQLENEKKKVIDKDGKIEKLLSQLENATRLQYENENLRSEIDNLNEMAQQDLTMQALKIEKMTQEIILLGSRNSALDREKEDLMALLEQRDYDNQMLKTGYGLHREKTRKGGDSTEMNGIANQLGLIDPDDAEYHETLDLAFMDSNSNKPMDLEDIDVENSEEFQNSMTGSASPTHKKAEIKEVADVTREYLHLTASVVNMKFPRIQHVSSEELINKVKNYQFWEYHDMMVRIMKKEEQEMLAKEKKEKEAKIAANNQNNTSSQQQGSGVLAGFRNFFRGVGQTRATRKSMVNPSTQKMSKKQDNNNNNNNNQNDNNTRTRNTSYHNKLDIDDAKKKGKEFIKKGGKKVMDLKDTTQQKITGKPSDKEIKHMNDESFASVGGLDSIYDDKTTSNQKVEKPNQTL